MYKVDLFHKFFELKKILFGKHHMLTLLHNAGKKDHLHCADSRSPIWSTNSKDHVVYNHHTEAASRGRHWGQLLCLVGDRVVHLHCRKKFSVGCFTTCKTAENIAYHRQTTVLCSCFDCLLVHYWLRYCSLVHICMHVWSKRVYVPYIYWVFQGWGWGVASTTLVNASV